MKNSIVSFPAILSASGLLDVDATISAASDAITVLSAKLEARAAKGPSTSVKLTLEEKQARRAERQSTEEFKASRTQRSETLAAAVQSILSSELLASGVAKTTEVVKAVCEVLGAKANSRELNVAMVNRYLREAATAPDSDTGWHVAKGSGGGVVLHPVAPKAKAKAPEVATEATTETITEDTTEVYSEVVSA